MLTGWFGIQVNLYMSSTGDRRYAEPGSLPFRLNERTRYDHDSHSLARSVFENFRASAFCLYPCEPNWVYPICNHYGLTSLLLYDRLFETSLVPRVRDRWLASLDTEFTDESGGIVGLRSSLTGLRFPFPGGHLPFATFTHCIDPERAWEMWAIARHDLERTLTKDASGEARLALPGRGFDFGNYRRGWGGTYAAIQAVAREFGDDEIARAAQRSLDRDGGRVDDRGVAHYDRMSNLSNLSAVLGQIRRRGDFRRAVTEGPPATVFEGPLLSEARYPDVLVARAFSHGAGRAGARLRGGRPGQRNARPRAPRPHAVAHRPRSLTCRLSRYRDVAHRRHASREATRPSGDCWGSATGGGRGLDRMVRLEPRPGPLPRPHRARAHGASGPGGRDRADREELRRAAAPHRGGRARRLR
jgi:hypothetical protein